MDHNNIGTGLTIAGDPAPTGGGGGIVRSRGNKIPSNPAVPPALMVQVNADPQVRHAVEAVVAAPEFRRKEAIGALIGWVIVTIFNTFLRYIYQVGTNQGGGGGFPGEPGGGGGTCIGGKKKRRRRTKRRRKRRTKRRR